MRIKFASLPNLTLLVALALSGVAAYYSIIGLTAIFAGAVVPVIIMGAMLEVAKLTTTVWLRKYWTKTGWILKAYLVPSVIVLALITSMGIFGFLSKAHIDQGATGGDVQANVSLIDEKIKTQRENIKASRDALAQMDLQVNNVIIKGDTEQSAARSVQIRRQQAKERAALQKEIETANATVGKLNEERAPIASQLRKVEAEVGPIKYVAAMIYGDNPDTNTLEKAVRWVIILLVLVFDPLAVALLLAANQSREWDVVEEVPNEVLPPEPEPEPEPEVTHVEHHGEFPALINEPLPEIITLVPKDDVPVVNEEPVVEEVAAVEEPVAVDVPEVVEEPIVEVATVVEEPITEVPTVVEAPAVDPADEFKELSGGYVSYQGKHIRKEALQALRPDLFIGTEGLTPRNTSFGSRFPEVARREDVFVRTDMVPNRKYRYDGLRWIPLGDANVVEDDPEYIQYLISKVDAGEYDVNLLTEQEKTQIKEYLDKPNLT